MISKDLRITRKKGVYHFKVNTFKLVGLRNHYSTIVYETEYSVQQTPRIHKRPNPSEGRQKIIYSHFAFCKVMSSLYTHRIIIEIYQFEDIQVL